MKRNLETGGRADRPHILQRLDEGPLDTGDEPQLRTDPEVEKYLERTDTSTAAKSEWLLERGLAERFIQFWRDSPKPAIVVRNAVVADGFADALTNAKSPLQVASLVSIQLGSEFTDSAASSLVRAISANPHVFGSIHLDFLDKGTCAADCSKAILLAAHAVPNLTFSSNLGSKADGQVKAAFKEHFAHVPAGANKLMVDIAAVEVGQCAQQLQECPALDSLGTLVLVSRRQTHLDWPNLLEQCKSLDHLELHIPGLARGMTSEQICAIGALPIRSLYCHVDANNLMPILNLVANGASRVSDLTLVHKSAQPLNLDAQVVAGFTSAIVQLLSSNRLTALNFPALIDLSALARIGPALNASSRLERLVLCGGFHSPEGSPRDFEPIYRVLAASPHLMSVDLRNKSCFLPPGWRYPTAPEADLAAAVGTNNRLRFGEERKFVHGAVIGFVQEINLPTDFSHILTRYIDNKTALNLSSVSRHARRLAVDMRMSAHVANLRNRLVAAHATVGSAPVDDKQIEIQVRKSEFEYGLQLIGAGGPAPARDWFVRVVKDDELANWLTQEGNAQALLLALPAFRNANLGIGDIGQWFVKVTEACDWQQWASAPDGTTLLELLRALPVLGDAKVPLDIIGPWVFSLTIVEGLRAETIEPADAEKAELSTIIKCLIAVGLSYQEMVHTLLSPEICQDQWAAVDVFNAMDGPSLLALVDGTISAEGIEYLTECHANPGLSFYVAFGVVIPGSDEGALMQDHGTLLETFPA